MTEENHQLRDYLIEILPTLSLDPETYLPYITGCLDTFQDDEEELDEIIGLLQASSESHSDDEQVWPKLKEDIIKRHQEYKDELKELNQKKDEERREIEAMKKQEDVEEAHKEKERKRIAELEKAEKNNDMDPAKKALIEQYAYDMSEIYDNNGQVVELNTAGKGEAEPTSNKAVADKANKERSEQMRGAQNVSTKKDERAKTKQAKLDKVQQKEERRKKTGKLERKR